MQYALISPIMDVNSGQYRTQVRNIATGVRTKVIGLDVNGAPTSDLELIQRLVLGLSGTPILDSNNQQIDAFIWVGWHPLVADNIRDRYFDIQTAGLLQIPFNPPGPQWTEDFMIARLKQYASEHGCEAYWLIRPGDSLTTNTPADLLAKFVPFTTGL